MTDPEELVPPPRVEPGHGRPPGRDENAVLGWAKAIALGIRDTAQDVLDEGRKGARRAYEEGWQEYDRKTKGRQARRREH